MGQIGCTHNITTNSSFIGGGQGIAAKIMEENNTFVAYYLFLDLEYKSYDFEASKIVIQNMSLSCTNRANI